MVVTDGVARKPSSGWLERNPVWSTVSTELERSGKLTVSLAGLHIGDAGEIGLHSPGKNLQFDDKFAGVLHRIGWLEKDLVWSAASTELSAALAGLHISDAGETGLYSPVKNLQFDDKFSGEPLC